MSYNNSITKTGDNWTREQIAFADEYARTGSITKSSAKAGLHYNAGHAIINSPNGLRLLRSIFVKMLTAELSPKAFAILRSYMDMDPASQKLSKTQLEAAKPILDRAGFIAPKASVPIASDSNLAGKSMAELNEIIDSGKRMIARLNAQELQVIDNEPPEFMQ